MILNNNLLLMVIEILFFYSLVLGLHALRRRITLVPLLTVLGGLAAMMYWISAASLIVEVNGISFFISSTIFYTSFLMGVFVIYLFDGPIATRNSILIIISVSIIVPLISMGLNLQAELSGGMVSQLPMPKFRVSLSSIVATLIDLVFLAILWEYLSKAAIKIPLFLRVYLTLLGAMWLDVLLFGTCAFCGSGFYWDYLGSTLLSRFIISIFTFPFLWSYILWQNSRHKINVQKRPAWKILGEIVEIKQELHTVKQELEEQKKIEEIIRKSEERYKDLFEKSEDAILIIKNGKFIDCNQATVRMLKYVNKDELLNSHPSELSPEKQPDGRFSFEKAEEMIKIAVEKGSHRFEWEHRKQTGEIFPVEVLLTSILSRDKERFIHTVWRDISKQKAAEQSKLEFEKQILQTQKLESLGVLAGGIAHDFNNILMGILGYADLAMLALNPQSPAKTYIEGISNSSRKAADLIKQMLAYSGKGKFTLEPIDLNQLIADTVQMLTISISKNAVMKFNYSPEPVKLEGDPSQIRQIIMNLVINASEAIEKNSGVIALSTGTMYCDQEYIDKSGFETHVSRETPLVEGMYAFVEVSDTGIGMSREIMARIFDPFFTTKFTGRGLGLSAVLGIANGHHGMVKIYSEEQKGTTFKVLFPLYKDADTAQEVVSSVEVTSEQWQGKGSFLIADDEEAVRAVGKHMIKKLGFDVFTANDGHEAIEVFRKNADDIVGVLLDLTMPHKDGAQVFQEIRRIKPEIRVILSSGYNEQDATQKFIGKGLAGFIQKPYISSDLQKKIQEVFEKDNTPDEMP